MEQLLINSLGIGHMEIGRTFVVGGTQFSLPQAGVATVNRAEQKRSLLGEDLLILEVETSIPLPWQIGHTIDVFGVRYRLQQMPSAQKNADSKFIYNLTFEGPQYDLLRAQYRNGNGEADFSLIGSIEDFATLLISNVERVIPGVWVLGDVPQTDARNLTFSGENCLAVLQRICQLYETEFTIVQSGDIKTLHIGKTGQTIGHTYEYGRGKGLYQLRRQTVSDKEIVTRLYAYGSQRNLKSNYRNFSQRLKFSTDSYLEDVDAIAKHGVVEGTKIFEEIYPHREGTVTSVDDNDELAFFDSAMPFDLNETDSNGTKWLIPGTSAKIHFNTGNLAGYEFEVLSYVHSTRRFKLIQITDERGQKFPDPNTAAFQISQGDKYVLLDIVMPDSYVTAAETELQSKAQNYLDQNKSPRVQYGLEIDEAFLKDQAGSGSIPNFYSVGDLVPIKDDDIGVDKSVRVVGFTRDALRPFRYNLQISDTYQVDIRQRLIADNVELKKIVKINDLTDPARAKQAWRTTQELLNMVFDVDGYFDGGNIRPNSITTQMLSVGSKPQQYLLRDIVIEPNLNGNPNQVSVSSGQLIHYTISTSPVTWIITGGTTTIVNNDARYIYARCNKVDFNDASIIFSTQQLQPEEDPNYYHFVVGVLHSVDNGVRWISLTYGSTSINGRFIKTGRIQSGDGSTYFDLDLGEIGGKIVFTRGGQEVTLEDLGQESDETKDYINNTLPGILDDIQGQLDGVIEQHFFEYDPTTSNEPAVSWNTTQLKEDHLGDLFYNTLTDNVWRWVKNSTPTYFWKLLEGSDAAEALAIANEALALADTKRRIFVTTPFTPYEVGDLWAQGPGGDIMRCKTTRLTGSFAAGDWEKSNKYTDDTALNNFLSGQFVSTISDLTNQIDGKIVSYFQSTNPNNWAVVDRPKHNGDMWYKTDTKELFRYHASQNQWQKIEDERAIAAYDLASKAQDTADGKRRVFVSTPTPPYDVGDLWVNGQLLRRCATAKVAGQSYNALDWVEPVYYDNTQTVIDGGIVTSGRIQLAGSGGAILAGITGEGTAGTSVRMWAGASYGNRSIAPFRVQQDGKLFATNANISGSTFSGEIIANSGQIGGFSISASRIGSDVGSIDNPNNGMSLYPDFIKFADSGLGTFVLIGSNVLPGTAGVPAVGRFESKKSNSFGTNYGILITVENGGNNIAAKVKGNIAVDGYVGSHGYSYIALSSSGNVLPFNRNGHVLVNCTLSTHTTAFLPSPNTVRSALGLSGSEQFAVRLSVTSAYTSNRSFNLLENGWNMYNNVGAINSVDLNTSDTAEFLLYYNGQSYIAQIITLFR